MPPHSDPPRPIPERDPTAFEMWFRRSLQDAYEPVLHEPVPPDIVAALPPATRQD
jgi:hypothetical protein